MVRQTPADAFQDVSDATGIGVEQISGLTAAKAGDVAVLNTLRSREKVEIDEFLVRAIESAAFSSQTLNHTVAEYYENAVLTSDMLHLQGKEIGAQLDNLANYLHFRLPETFKDINENMENPKKIKSLIMLGFARCFNQLIERMDNEYAGIVQSDIAHFNIPDALDGQIDYLGYRLPETRNFEMCVMTTGNVGDYFGMQAEGGNLQLFGNARRFTGKAASGNAKFDISGQLGRKPFDELNGQASVQLYGVASSWGKPHKDWVGELKVNGEDMTLPFKYGEMPS